MSIHDFDMSDMTWKERLPHLKSRDFSPEEMREIGEAAALDLLTNSEMRTLVILFSRV